jgi:amidase
MRSAGAIVLGKTHMPRLCGDCQATSPMFGITRNPWNPDRTPGGTSGGEAAAISAGFSALGVGGDFGGSVRSPAHYCGVYSFKPGDHRIPNRGKIPPLPGGLQTARCMEVSGAMARSVADLRLWFTVVAGPDPEEPDIMPIPLGDSPPRRLEQLRLAWSDDLGGVPVAEETRRALADFAKKLEREGVHIEKRLPEGFDFQAAFRVYFELYAAMVFSVLPRGRRFVSSLVRPLVRDPCYRVALGRISTNARQYFQSLAERDHLRVALSRFLSRYDAFLCPVTSDCAFRHRRPYRPDLPLEVDGKPTSGVLATMAHTMVFSLTGNPVVGLPIALSKEGLPIGVQVVGRSWGEMELLRVAEILAEIIGPYCPPPTI